MYRGTEYEHKLLCAVTYSIVGCDRRAVKFKYNSRLVGYLKERKSYLNSKKYEYNGEIHTLREFSRIYNISYDKLRRRVRSMPIQRAIEMEP